MQWLGHPKEEEKSHGSLVIYFTDKTLAHQILRGGLIFDGNFMRTMPYTQGPPQCFNCLKTGHMAFQCKNDPICSKCGNSHLPQDCKDPGYAPSIKRCTERDPNIKPPTSTPWRITPKQETLPCKTTTKKIFHLEIIEPWINPHTCLPPLHQNWHRITPNANPRNKDNKPRACTYINKRIPAHQITNHIQESHLLSITTISNLSETIPDITILSLYNPPSTFTGIDLLNQWLQNNSTRQTPTFIMMDSNLHHPHWNPKGYTHTHTQARDLIKACGRKGFRLISPRHTPTFLGAVGKPTAIDLTWANHKSRLLLPITQVQLNNHSSDHHPILTKITLPHSLTLPPQKHLTMRLNQLNPDLFLDHLGQLLLTTANTTETDTPNATDKTIQDLSTAILTAYNNQGKWVNTNPARAKAWWDKRQLDELVKLRNQARREMLKRQTDKTQKTYYHHQQQFKQKVWELKSDLDLKFENNSNRILQFISHNVFNLSNGHRDIAAQIQSYSFLSIPDDHTITSRVNLLNQIINTVNNSHITRPSSPSKPYRLQLFGSTQFGLDSQTSDLDLCLIDPDRPNGA
ncbi:hypothetical protein O181_033604 [Austropuccinia psidii MF-1]|uniref:CCHC-type domain-containing protein n=1 Tax=Austropuccinia psidii MF-1 TaxID=1389203 RepID=A0A9Q3CZ29_9BASI|nr:hypothetical protein [Austropuccinia psidii MF-1]